MLNVTPMLESYLENMPVVIIATCMCFDPLSRDLPVP